MSGAVANPAQTVGITGGTISGVTITSSTITKTVTNKSADYTLVLADADSWIVHPSTDNNPRTFTVPANASVAFPIGTEITIFNQINTLSIAITTDTMTMAGQTSATTGTRTLAANGMAKLMKIATTSWIISLINGA